MNIALCFSGQPRKISSVLPALRRYILQPLSKYNVYVFMHLPVGSTVPDIGIPPSSVLQEDESLVSPPPCKSLNHGIVSRPWHDQSPYRSFYLQVRSISQSFEIARLYALKRRINFDWVFRLRYDNLYFGEPVEDLATLDSDAVYLPSHDNWGGYNDRFAFGSPRCMDSYSKRYQYFAVRQELGLDVGPEPFLKWVLERDFVNVRRTRVCHHLFRHGEIWFAHYLHQCGDIKPKCFFLYHYLRPLLARTITRKAVESYIPNRARFLP